MGDLPICCTLTPAERSAGHEDLLPGLLSRAAERIDTPGGVRLRFDTTPGLLDTIARVLDRERGCCRFLRFTLTLGQDLGPVWLEIDGPPGTKDFLADLLTAR